LSNTFALPLLRNHLAGENIVLTRLKFLQIGKSVYFSDVYTEDTEKFRKFVEQLNVMCNEN